MSTVDTLIRLAETQIRNTLLVLREELVPTWLIIARDGTPHIHATPWDSDVKKQIAQVFIALQMRNYEAQAYSFICEAWAANAPKDWDPRTELPEKERPMNRVDRVEVVVAFASDGECKKWRRWDIRRDWQDQIITLEPSDEFTGVEGWIADLL